MKRNQSGIAHLLPVVIILLVMVIGSVGWFVWSKQKSNGSTASNDNGYVAWSFNGSNWQPDGKAPVCEEPLAITAPIDVSKATSVLYPGQLRSGNYKAHGGIGVDNATTNNLDVTALRNAYLYRGSRYIEQGATQYLFDFVDPCGIMYRYDHLATLSPQFQTYADQLPAAKPDQSQTTVFNEHPYIKQGTLIATAVGYSQPVNAFFDVGVYDLRNPNAASKTALFASDRQRQQAKELSHFAVCWFDLLQGTDKTTVAGLPPRNAAENSSDFCQVN